MKKMDTARFYRNGYEAMRTEIMKDIANALMEAKDNLLDLDDVHGSLIFNPINDQENAVIMSIFKSDGVKHINMIANIGVYEPEYKVNMDDMHIEMLLNIMDAVEVAVNKE